MTFLRSLIVLFTLATWAVAAPPDFDRAVAPIFSSCLECHTGEDAKGKLDLSRRQSATAGGRSGDPGLVPGKPAESSVWDRVNADEMPPKKPLSAADKATLKAWIEAGAVWGTDPVDPLAHTTDSRAGRDWWVFQPVKRPTPPTPKPESGVVANDIDRFVLAKLEANGLTASPAADRRTLIRRLKFDLLGLPPTPEEVAEFVNDDSPNAYQQLVDRYLASPHYGERWARHWLDVVRFAESHGFETNTVRDNAWPYRDWVIAALNADKPYDRFVFEQLAGDTVGADAATGFLVAGPWDAVKSPDPVLTANQRADELHDIVSTVGSAFLGLSVGCARCHTHKFDPIPQVDYYRLKAAFSGVQHGTRELRTADQDAKTKRVDVLKREIALAETTLAEFEPLADPAALEPRRRAVNPRMNVERFRPVKAKFVRMVVYETSSVEPCIDEFEVYSAGENPTNVALSSAGAKATSAGDYPGSDIHRLQFVNDGIHGNSRSWISNTPGRGRLVIELKEPIEIDRVVWGRDRTEKFKDRLATRYRIDVSADGEGWQVVASSDDRARQDSTEPLPPGLNEEGRVRWEGVSKKLAGLRIELEQLLRAEVAYVGRFTTPEKVFRLHRGDPMTPREEVGAGTLSGIRPEVTIPVDATDADRRVAVAKWVTDPTNPLTPRVLVNRLWQHHFGAGIVSTPSDFGFNGGRPTHPELIDWLAAELVEHDWSLKHLHRLIASSATYRQSSASTPDGLSKDAGSRLLWRYPPRRLEAEAIRDAILAVSGKIDLTRGGPGFDLFEPNTNYVKVYTPKTEFGPAEFRRMIYQQKPRMQLDDTFGAFDCPDAGQAAPKRNESTTPLQALNLLNSPFLVQQAGYFADRVAGEEEDHQGRVRRAFQLAFQREPSDKELSAGAALVAEHGLSALCRALLNANEFLYVD